MTTIIDLWFNTEKWVSDSEQGDNRSFLPVFFITALLIPTCSLLGEAVINSHTTSVFLMVLSFQFWSLVLYFIVSNLIITSLLYFIATLIHEQNSRSHSTRFFYASILLSATPMVLIPALALLSRYTGMGTGLFSVFKFVIFLWTFIIQVSIIKSIFGFTSMKSALLYVTSILTLLSFDILLIFNSLFSIFTRLS